MVTHVTKITLQIYKKLIMIAIILYYLLFLLTSIMTGRWKGTLGSSLSMYCHVLHECVDGWIGGGRGGGETTNTP